MWPPQPPTSKALSSLYLPYRDAPTELPRAEDISLAQAFIFHLHVFLFFCFLGPHPQHKEVPRLGVELELQLPMYTTATATQDLSHGCDLHRSSWQHQIPNPLSKARNWTHILMDTSQIRYSWATLGTPGNVLIMVVLWQHIIGVGINKISLVSDKYSVSHHIVCVCVSLEV